MNSGQDYTAVGRMAVQVDKQTRVLAVFDEEDEMTEALGVASETLGFSQTKAASYEQAIRFQTSEFHQLIVIDHRRHSEIDADGLCRALRATNCGEYLAIVAVVNKSCIEEQDEILIPLLYTGFNRLLMETTNVKKCLMELLQLERNLVRINEKLCACELLLSALDGCKEAIQISNSRNNIQYVNKAFEKLLGYSSSEVIGQNLQQVYGVELAKFENLDPSSTSNGKNSEGSTNIKKKSGDVVSVQYRVTCGPKSKNAGHVVYLSDGSGLNKPSIADSSSDIQSYLRGSMKSSKRCSAEFRSTSGESGVPMFNRRQSVAKLHAMTIEAPITKVISILTAVSEDSSPGIATSLATVLDILRSTELYNPQHLNNQSLVASDEDQTTTDLVGGLLHRDKPPPQSIQRRQSQENSSVKSQGTQLLPDFDAAPMALKSLLEQQLDWDFDIIELETLTTKRPLVWIGMSIMTRFEVCERLQCEEETLHKWLTLMESNYHSENSYHNSTHAADVMQATAYFLETKRLKTMLDSMDEVACLLAAIVHDLDHPGKTSAFLCNSNNQLAILYNDLSVLESHHSALAFNLTTSNERVNIFKNLDRDTYRSLRKSIVDMVLATEMNKHFEHLSKFINVFTKPAYHEPDLISIHSEAEEPDVESLITPENIVLIKRILIKCADVNNPLRPLHTCVEWGHRIAEEYFAQNDEEKQLGLTVVMPTFDRSTCNIPKSQIGFIDYFINDMFAAWEAFVDMPELLTHLKNNYNYWKDQENVVCVANDPLTLSDVEESDVETSEATSRVKFN
ncbi:PDE8A (predicted) [Pycnogonum litorale]